MLATAMAMPAAACLNSYSFEIKQLLQKNLRPQALQEIAELERAYKTNKSAEITNDLAVARILFGRVDEAIVLLQELEERHPGKGTTAANLGTAFELAGKDQAALQWIREGIRRDPKEHFGSEWVHVRILEAKLAIKVDANWLDTHSVMGMSFGDAPQPAEPALPVDHLGHEHSLAETRRAISYQLFERTLLVKPKDRVVADLYLTASDLAFLMFMKETVAERQRQMASALRTGYESALSYGDPRTDLINRRMAELERLIPDPLAVKKP
ncbi:MAG TPA: tetratricopeptide repeat protein [Steroidobacteraceae bacterium]|nr:tetratricopeptide repeat protein [Steroidobacteraceae bacterium]